MKYDVVIVGAGPAGSTAAKFLAEKGINVLLIDKSKFPRDKSCGGGLPVRALRQFPYLENSDLIESYSYGGIAYYSTSSDRAELHRKDPILAMVRREKFDYGLVKLAIKSGATFLNEKSAKDVRLSEKNVTLILEDGSKIETEIIIGADGVWSTLARKAGLCPNKRPTSMCVFQEYPMDSTMIDRYFSEKRLCYIFLRFQDVVGYAWVFPKKSHVNIGIDEVRLPGADPQYKINLKEVYIQFIDVLRQQKVLPEDFKIGKVRGAALPIFPLDKTYADRLLMCGDAGGFINPITGEGLYYAMASGKLAAEVCIQAFEARDTSSRFLSRYETMWKQEFGDDLKLLLRIHKRWNRDVKKYFQLAASDRMLSEMILDVATGQIGARECRWKLLRRFLYVYLKNLIRKKK